LYRHPLPLQHGCQARIPLPGLMLPSSQQKRLLLPRLLLPLPRLISRK
jgi:hypothetical protein